jgi:hypothetical protein
MTLTSNNQGRFRFDTFPAQKQHFDTPNSYRDSESTSPDNPIRKPQKKGTPTTPFAALNESVRDSSIPSNLAHSDLAPRQTETLSNPENPLVLNIC